MFYWVISVAVLWYFAAKRAKTKEEIPNANRKGYDLHTFKAPRVSGRGLRAAAFLLEIPLLSNAIVWLLFRRNKFHTLRNLKFSCPPTFYPLVVDFKHNIEIDDHSKLSAPTYLEKEITKVHKRDEMKQFAIPQINDYASCYTSNRILPSEVAEQVLKEINGEKGKKLHYVAHMSQREEILREARLADARYKSGNPLSVIDGIPILVKDEFSVKGLPTTCGTSFHTTPAKEDSTIVRKLREKGALIIGKSNMVEIGISAKGVNPHYGTPRNPYNVLHHTGGSSAGSAGAVSSGLVPLATAADIGGSIRIPAAICGAVGLKPTFGRVSNHGGFPLSWTLGHAGPIASTVRDCATGYAIMAGKDSQDENTQFQPEVVLPNFDLVFADPSPLRGLRVGVYSPWFDHAAPEIVRSCRIAVDTLVSLGAEKVEVTLMDGIFEFCRLAHTMVILSEMRSSIHSFLECGETRTKFGLDSQLTLCVSKPLTATDYMQANCLRTLAIQSMKAAFPSVDFIITPATATTAPRINTPDGKEEIDVQMEALLMRYVFVGNFVGVPALTMPCGYTPEGLPIAVQLLGRWWEEHVILKAAFALESQITKREPAVAFTNLPTYKS